MERVPPRAASRDQTLRVQHELNSNVNGLREKTHAVRNAVLQAQAKLEHGGRQLLELAAQAERDRQLCSRSGHATEDSALQQAIFMLEQRLAALQAEENDHRRGAEFELERLEARALEVERNETQPALNAVVQLPALRAEIAAEARQLHGLREHVLAQEREAFQATSLEEQRYFEWGRMLLEDRPDHIALAIVEEDCDAWEHQLHGVISPVAFRDSGFRRGQGLERLDAELGSIGAAERAKRASCAECFERLVDEGSWRSVFSEILEAYKFVDNLRGNNDALAGEIAGLRWRRHGSTMPPAGGAEAVNNGAAQSTVVTQPNLPPGPRFNAPVLSKPKVQPNGPVDDDEERPGTSMPRAVTSDRCDWEASGREGPKRPEEKGIAFLCQGSKQRFKPSLAIPANSGFDSVWGSQDAESLWNKTPTRESRASSLPATKPVKPAMGAGELARLAAAAFKEPLTSSLGTGKLPRSSPLPSPNDQTSQLQPRVRTEWVTFSEYSAAASANAQAAATSPGRLQETRGFAPINTVPGIAGGLASVQTGEWGAAGAAWSLSTPQSIESDTDASSAWGCQGLASATKTAKSSHTPFGACDGARWNEEPEFQSSGGFG